MATSCTSTCINDAGDPFRATYVNLYKWPESEKEFVMSVSSNGLRGSHQHPKVVDSISCRQIYLRSYTFSRKKESVQEKITKKCFGRVKERVKNRRSSRIRNKKSVVIKRKCLMLTGAKEVSCSALLFCVSKIVVLYSKSRCC